MPLRFVVPLLLVLLAVVYGSNIIGHDSKLRSEAFKQEVLERALAMKQSPIPNPYLNTRADRVINCNETVPCLTNSYEICHRGQCQCQHPSESYYWYSYDQCQIDAGRPCEPEEGTTPCIKNTECLPDPKSRTGHTCTCKVGMESDGFYCVKAFGEKCDPSAWWGSDDGCNYVAGQDCIEERCQCYTEPDQVFDPIQKRCVGREGYPCIVLDLGWLGCRSGTKCVRRDDMAEYPLFGVCRKV